MTELKIDLPGRGYPILIGEDALADGAKRLISRFPEKRAAVVTDENVWKLHRERLASLFDSCGIATLISVIRPGERSKSIGALSRLYSEFANFGLKRGDPVVAFGGGVVGDLAGFAAATYMRGAPFVQIPTTLLAQVDSSVGGKVAVNLPEGKNLVGSFYQPDLVVADTGLLSTLPDREWNAGMAEVIKYAAIDETSLIPLIKGRNGTEGGIGEIVRLCCMCKAGFVERDEMDAGPRMMLNFGHTFGHAIEKYHSFEKYNHGEAVAAGMALAARTGEMLGLTDAGTYERLAALMDAAGIDYEFCENVMALIPLMSGDKKNTGDEITLILLKRIGHPFAHRIRPEKLLEMAEGFVQTPHFFASGRDMGDIKKVSLFPYGRIDIPPSKSVSHRALICSGLAEGEGAIKNLAASDDIDATARCMGEIRKALYGNHPQLGPLDCGESGSTLRFLIPLAALFPCSTSFTGRGRLMERPLDRYLEELALHGASCKLSDGMLDISGPLKAGLYNIPGNISSQFITGLLLALPLLGGDSEIAVASPLESAPYVDITIDVMEQFGIQVKRRGYQRFLIKGGQKYRACEFAVESDYSQASFFLVSGALGADCACIGLNPESSQGDKRIIDILRRSGVKIVSDSHGGLSALPGAFAAQTVDVSDIPDLVPPLAVFFSFCEGTSRIVNAGRLRYKESDRLAAVAGELGKLGAKIKILDDSLEITGVKTLNGGIMSSRGDHRIAMMGAVAALRCETPVYIEGASCVGKSYPGFWADFMKRAIT